MHRRIYCEVTDLMHVLSAIYLVVMSLRPTTGSGFYWKTRFLQSSYRITTNEIICRQKGRIINKWTIFLEVSSQRMRGKISN